MERAIAVLAVGSVLTLAASRATAQEQLESASEGYYYTEYEPTWYGWQMLVIDAPVVATFFVAEYADAQPVALGAGGVYVLSGPVVHALHGKRVEALISGMGRLLVPLGTMLVIGEGVRMVDDTVAEHKRAAIGATMGALLVSVGDAYALAYGEKTTRVPLEGKREGALWVPQVGLGNGSAMLGVTGVF
ncbi:MAG: hypothetical protein MUF54_16135 [Polyangiaceae bacterium]|nr:hypothetical protein [Polyangiaceae bacterium]